MRNLPEKLSVELSEIRFDIKGSTSGRLRLGVAVIVATVVVTASGWPPGDVVHRTLFLVMGAVPSTVLGIGLIVAELIQVRVDRHGELNADDREVEVLRACIVADVRRRTGYVPSAHDVLPCEPEPRAVPRPSAARRRGPVRRRRLVAGRRRSGLLSRSGMLGLR